MEGILVYRPVKRIINNLKFNYLKDWNRFCNSWQNSVMIRNMVIQYLSGTGLESNPVFFLSLGF